MALKKLFEDNPELINYLENEDYKNFSDSINNFHNPFRKEYELTDDEAKELTKKLYDADILDDILEDLEIIPNWCEFGDFTYYEIPEGVNSIRRGAFYNCRYLKSITIPNSVKEIGNSAFDNCSSLNSITIPNGVTSIEHNAFGNCSSLTSITIPNSVTLIENEAFRNCSSLTSITIPNSVKEIGTGVFSLCSSLVTVYVDMTKDEFIKACGSQKYRYTLYIPKQTKVYFKQ